MDVIYWYIDCLRPIPGVGGVSVGVYTCVRGILHVRNKFIACVEFLKSMCRRAEMDSCNFRDEGL